MHRFLGVGLLVLGSLTAAATAEAQTDFWGNCPQLTGWYSCTSDVGDSYFISYKGSVGRDGRVIYTRSYAEPRSDGSRKTWPDQVLDTFSCTDQKVVTVHGATKTAVSMRDDHLFIEFARGSRRVQTTCRSDAAGNLMAAAGTKTRGPAATAVNEGQGKTPVFANTFDLPTDIPSVTTDGFIPPDKPI